MPQEILELDALTVNMLVTEDLYPLPAETIIDENFGNDNVLVTNKAGEVLEVVTGQHMVLGFDSAVEFTDWIDCRSFWLFDSEKQKFQKIQITKTENG